MQIPQKNWHNQAPRNSIADKEIYPNFGEKCFRTHPNNQLYVTGGCNWRKMMSLSWVPEEGRSDFVPRLCGGDGLEMMMTHEGEFSEWVGCTEKDKNPKAKVITHRRKRTETQTRRRRRRKTEIHQSSEWVCRSLHTKTYKYVCNVEVLRKKAFQNFNHLTQCETILCSKLFLYTYYSTHKRTSLLLQQQCMIQAFRVLE